MPKVIYNTHSTPRLNLTKSLRMCACISPFLMFSVVCFWQLNNSRNSNHATTTPTSPVGHAFPVRHKYTTNIQKTNNMHTRVSIAPQPELFDDAVKEQLSHNKSVFVYVIGARDEHGKSWCPDCVRADPIVDEALGNFNRQAIILEAPVIRNEYKGNPEYPYRKHPQLQIKGVPTLIHWTKEGPKERLVENELFDKENVEKFFQSIAN